MTKRQQITVMSCGTIWEHPSRAIAIRYIEDRDYRTLPAPSSWINSISVRSIIISPRWSRSHLTNRRAPRTRCSCRPSPDETFSSASRRITRAEMEAGGDAARALVLRSVSVDSSTDRWVDCRDLRSVARQGVGGGGWTSGTLSPR